MINGHPVSAALHNAHNRQPIFDPDAFNYNNAGDETEWENNQGKETSGGRISGGDHARVPPTSTTKARFPMPTIYYHLVEL